MSRRLKGLLKCLVIVFAGILVAAPALALDTDNDGMPDAWEDSYACVDSATEDATGDPDGEGLNNLAEFEAGTDPCMADTDGDGSSDTDEKYSGSDPLDPELTPGFAGFWDDLVIFSSDNYEGRIIDAVWTGSEYAIFWVQPGPVPHGGRIFMGLVSEASGASSPVVLVDGFTPADWPSADVQWTGSEFGLAWSGMRPGDTLMNVYFTRVSSSGSTLGELKVSTLDYEDQVWPSLAWSGSEYGITWQRGDSVTGDRVYFSRLDQDGNLLSSPMRVTDADMLENIVVVPVYYVPPDRDVIWLSPEGWEVHGLCYRLKRLYPCYKPGSTADQNFILYHQVHGYEAEETENNKVLLGMWVSSVGNPEAFCHVDLDEVWGDAPYKRWRYFYHKHRYYIPVSDGHFERRNIYAPCLATDPDAVAIDYTGTRTSTPGTETIWNGNEYGVLWINRNSGLQITGMTSVGLKMGFDKPLPGYGNDLSWQGDIIWTGSSFIAPYLDGSVNMLSFNVEGDTVSTQSIVLNGSTEVVASVLAAEMGAGFAGVSWRGPQDVGDGLYFNLAAADGSPIGNEVLVSRGDTLSAAPSTVQRPAMAWSGSEYGVAWFDYTPGGGGSIKFSRLGPDSDGDQLADDKESIVYGTDPYNPDSDGDGFTDGDEVILHGTDPTDPASNADNPPDHKDSGKLTHLWNSGGSSRGPFGCWVGGHPPALSGLVLNCVVIAIPLFAGLVLRPGRRRN